MPKGIMVVQSSPSDPAREDEYNDWYSNTHLPEVRDIPGIVAARRYKVRDMGDAAASGPAYLAIYEIEADDVTGPIKELRARSASGQLQLTDVVQLDPPPVVALYELID